MYNIIVLQTNNLYWSREYKIIHHRYTFHIIYMYNIGMGEFVKVFERRVMGKRLIKEKLHIFSILKNHSLKSNCSTGTATTTVHYHIIVRYDNYLYFPSDTPRIIDTATSKIIRPRAVRSKI